jgi:hypothetical protein
MAAMIERARKRLSKRAEKGFRGWPVATVALYGQDDSTATKLTVGIIPAEDAAATGLRRWFSKEQTDIRDDIRVTEEVLAFIAEAGAKSKHARRLRSVGVKLIAFDDASSSGHRS